MEGRTPRHHHRSRSGRAPPPPPHPHQNPSRYFLNTAPRAPPAAIDAMEDDAITTLMDIDDSPRSAVGASFLDDDEDGETFHANRMGGRGNEARGPLPFAGFFNTFDSADFDDTDLA